MGPGREKGLLSSWPRRWGHVHRPQCGAGGLAWPLVPWAVQALDPLQAGASASTQPGSARAGLQSLWEGQPCLDTALCPAGLAVSREEWGRVGCLPGLRSCLPCLYLGRPGLGVWLSLFTCGPCPWSFARHVPSHTPVLLSSAFWSSASHWNVLGLPAPCAQGLQVGRGLGGAPFPLLPIAQSVA